MMMTRKQAAEFMGKTPGLIDHYVRAGSIRAVHHSDGRVYVNAQDVAALAGKELPAEHRLARQGSGTIFTDDVRRAREELLKAVSDACARSGLSRDEVEGKLSYFITGVWEELETIAASAG